MEKNVFFSTFFSKKIVVELALYSITIEYVQVLLSFRSSYHTKNMKLIFKNFSFSIIVV